jgi:hypothetical protein
MTTGSTWRTTEPFMSILLHGPTQPARHGTLLGRAETIGRLRISGRQSQHSTQKAANLSQLCPNNWVPARPVGSRYVSRSQSGGTREQRKWHRVGRTGNQWDYLDLPDNAEVAGSIPASPTRELPDPPPALRKCVKTLDVNGDKWSPMLIHGCQFRATTPTCTKG